MTIIWLLTYIDFVFMVSLKIEVFGFEHDGKEKTLHSFRVEVLEEDSTSLFLVSSVLRFLFPRAEGVRVSIM